MEPQGVSRGWKITAIVAGTAATGYTMLVFGGINKQGVPLPGSELLMLCTGGW